MNPEEEEKQLLFVLHLKKGIKMSNKYVVKKFDGDDSYSYAIFKKEDVKGLGKIIFWGRSQNNNIRSFFTTS